jgi:hypothetical protein
MTRRRATAGVLVTALAAVGPAWPATAQTPGDLPRWLAGCWAGSRGEERFHERWTAADADTLIGIAHTVKAGRLSAFEFLRIVRREGRLVYIAQPNGAPPTEFVAAAPAAAEVVFANPAHDFPKRVGYRRPGPDALTAWIDGGPGSKGPAIEFVMTRRTCEP